MTTTTECIPKVGRTGKRSVMGPFVVLKAASPQRKVKKIVRRKRKAGR